MTTQKEERELAKTQLASTDQKALVAVEDRAKEDEKGALYVPLREDRFKLKPAEEVSLFPLMEWAAADEQGANLAAVYRIIKSLVHDDDWSRFTRFAGSVKPRLEINEYVAFQNVAFEVLSANPTEQPAPSSDTSSETSGDSTGTSSRRRAAASKA